VRRGLEVMWIIDGLGLALAAALSMVLSSGFKIYYFVFDF
jgi:hypothetical protein